MTFKNNKLTMLSAFILSATIMYAATISIPAFADVDTLAGDKLIQRNFADWKNQYSNQEDFDTKEKSINAYANDYDSGKISHSHWNNVIVKDVIKIHNFDTIIGTTGNNQEIVALLVTKQKLEGNYNPSEPVKKFDDWIVSQQNVPNTVQQIDQRLLEILGDSKYLDKTQQFLDAVHESATYGNVPNDLFDKDPAYWLKTSIVASCDTDLACKQKAKDAFSQSGNQANQVPTSSILDLIMPKAYAYTNDYITSYSGYLQAYQCEGSNTSPCTIQLGTTYGYGPLVLSYTTCTSTCTHLYGTYLTIHAAAYSVSGSTVTLFADASSLTDHTDYTSGSGYVIENHTWYGMGSNNSSSWTLTFTDTANAFH